MLALRMVSEQAQTDVRPESKALEILLAKDNITSIEVSETKGMHIGLDIALEGAIRAMYRRIGEYEDRPEKARKKGQAEMMSLLAQFRTK